MGCIAYALLTGRPPFQGPRVEDYQDQHLHKDPLPLVETHPRLRTLVTMMLRKSPQTRPSLSRVIRLLGDLGAEQAKQSRGAGFDALSRAGAAAAEAALAAQAAGIEDQARRLARKKLADSAFEALRHLMGTLFDTIIITPTPKQ